MRREEIAGLICNFCPSLAASRIIRETRTSSNLPFADCFYNSTHELLVALFLNSTAEGSSNRFLRIGIGLGLAADRRAGSLRAVLSLCINGAG